MQEVRREDGGGRRTAARRRTDGEEREKGEVRVCGEKVEWLKKSEKEVENGYGCVEGR